MASLPELIKKGECDALLIYWYSLLCCEDEVQRNRPAQPFCHKINRWTFECRMDWSRLYPIWCGVCGCDIAILKLRQQIIHATETWKMRTIPLITFQMHNTCERRTAHTWCKKKIGGPHRSAANCGCCTQHSAENTANCQGQASETLNCQHRQIMSYVLSKIR